MNIQDDDWDEFDLEDDFDESWDDDAMDTQVSEVLDPNESLPLGNPASVEKSKITSNASSKAKTRAAKNKRNPAFFILAVALLSSGAATYYFVSTNNIDTPMPVIKLEGISQAESPNADVSASSAESSPVPSQYIEEPKSVSRDELQSSILTPFPEGIENQDVT